MRQYGKGLLALMALWGSAAANADISNVSGFGDLQASGGAFAGGNTPQSPPVSLNWVGGQSYSNSVSVSNLDESFTTNASASGSGAAYESFVFNSNLGSISGGASSTEGGASGCGMAFGNTYCGSGGGAASAQETILFSLTTATAYSATATGSGNQPGSQTIDFALNGDSGSLFAGTSIDQSGVLTPGNYTIVINVNGSVATPTPGSTISGSQSLSFDMAFTSPVPLPASAWLLASGLFGLGGFLHRRRQSGAR